MDKVIEYLKRIEDTARAKVTGIINNTHMLKSTTASDVLNGQELAQKVSENLHIPIKYISVIENVAKSLPNNLQDKVFPMTLYMREDWMV